MADSPAADQLPAAGDGLEPPTSVLGLLQKESPSMSAQEEPPPEVAPPSPTDSARTEPYSPSPDAGTPLPDNPAITEPTSPTIPPSHGQAPELQLGLPAPTESVHDDPLGRNRARIPKIKREAAGPAVSSSSSSSSSSSPPPSTPALGRPQHSTACLRRTSGGQRRHGTVDLPPRGGNQNAPIHGRTLR